MTTEAYRAAVALTDDELAALDVVDKPAAFTGMVPGDAGTITAMGVVGHFHANNVPFWIQPLAPSDPSPGNLWIESGILERPPTSPTMGVHLYDGEQWLSMTVGTPLPIGSITSFAGTAAPAGWLLCAGQSVARADYPALFAVIGTAYGSDDDQTMRLPDLRGRVVASPDAMGGTPAGRLDWANAVGTSGGSQRHTLTIPELPAHNHNIQTVGPGAPEDWPATVRFGNGNAAKGVAATDQRGDGEGHNTMQPTILLASIIKALP